MKLLCLQNAKTPKGQKRGYLTGVLYLAPADMAGAGNVCPACTPECKAICLYSAGRGIFAPVKKSRIRKTRWLQRRRRSFIRTLERDIEALERKAVRENKIPAVRLNGTSDLPWHTKEYSEVIQKFPHIQFYDYTKVTSRLRESLPANYHVTLSRTARNERACRTALQTGRANVAVIFGGKLPARYLGRPVVDGDRDDLRFLDPKGSVVGLVAKGKARLTHNSAVVST